VLSGLNATIAILAAIEVRHKTGRGQQIDIALLDCVVQFAANQIASYYLTGKQPKRVGNAHVNLAPYQSFKTADGHMIVGAGNDSQWRKLAAAMGAPELAQRPEYFEMKDRNKNRGSLVNDMETILTTKPTQHWLDTFASLGIPHAPINTFDQVFAHPQVQHRQLRIDMQRPPEQGGGNIALVASPIRMSDTPVEYRYAPPAKGADTDAVMNELRPTRG
jgi:crotonobetainyl-CoA:carnitine CoA-transferase CaiB-like acyl-CoA transferase